MCVCVLMMFKRTNQPLRFVCTVNEVICLSNYMNVSMQLECTCVCVCVIEGRAVCIGV